MISNGSLLQHPEANKIAVDYAHKVGIVEGINEAINLIENIATEIDNMGDNDHERS